MSLSNTLTSVEHPLLRRVPDSCFIRDSEGELRSEDAIKQVCQTTIALKEQGVVAGERIALDMPVSRDWIILFLALIECGAEILPLNTRVPYEQRNELTQRVGVSRCLTSRPSPRLSPSSEYELEPWSLVSTATLLATSGSSGEPKIAVHSLGNHYFSAVGSNDNIPLGKGDCWLLSLPLFHVGGLGILFRVLLSDATVVLPEESSRAIENLACFDGITHLSLVPTQLKQLLATPHEEVRERLLRTKAVLLGGAALASSLIEQAHEAQIPLHTTYGSTEMSSQISTTPPCASSDDVYTAGIPLKYRQVAISNSGELLVRGEALFKGYLTPHGIDPARDCEGWFHTGDLGDMDEKGRIIVRGRLDNLIISGGENIQPEEIEQAILNCSGLFSLVVAREDELYGQRPVAFIEGEFDEQHLRSALENILPKYKVPDTFMALPSAYGAGNGRLKIARSQVCKLL